MKTIQLSQRHVVLHDVIHRLIRRIITEREASELLGKSVRQVRRLKQKVLVSGISGLVHGNAGKSPWNKSDSRSIEQIVLLYQTKYTGFNCLHFRDMLADHEGVTIPRESLRRIFVTHALPRKKRHAPRRFAHRERKPQTSMLIQQDTSP